MGERALGVLKRRGLLAGAATLVAGGLARLGGPAPTEAAHDGSADQTVLHADIANTTTGITQIVHTGTDIWAVRIASSGAFTTLQAESEGDRTAVRGTAYGAGGRAVRGTAHGDGRSYGVFGETDSADDAAAGVYGEATGLGSAQGVWGTTGSTDPFAAGVYGNASATNGQAPGIVGATASTASAVTGIFGVATGASGATHGIWGRTHSSAAASVGTRGEAGAGYGLYGTSQSGPGCFGGSTSGVGVYADSGSNTAVFATSPARGVWGRTTAGIGVLARATASGTVQNRGYGLYAAAPSPGWAGYFEGNVYVTGQLLIAGRPVGPVTGDAAASPSASEAFGRATLANGQARVELPPALAGKVGADDYDVFLTPYADLGALHVADRTASSFVIRAATPVSGQLAYRVVTRQPTAEAQRSPATARSAAEQAPPPALPDAPVAAPAAPSRPRR